MQVARKLFLLTAMALAALALTSGSAAATEHETAIEAAAVHCNPCPVHFAGPTTLGQHVFGSESTVSACTDEFVGAINEDGGGHITSYTNNHATDPANCTRVECADAAEHEWPITNAGETGPNAGHFTTRLCVREEGGPDRHCNVELQVELVGGEVTRWFANDARGTTATTGVYCEVTGDWAIEGPSLQIVHL